ncbi:hypothetical protein LBMAG53_05830 [Planctomycetota bacterium]|nr:hypothetical protein LBMAG53_05830 [Planctomycetota bacterium]
MEQTIDLKLAAGEATAGELASEQQAEFERLRRTDPALDREAAGWESMRQRLGGQTSPEPAICDPRLAERVLRRAAFTVLPGSGASGRFGTSSRLALAATLGLAVGAAGAVIFGALTVPLPDAQVFAESGAPQADLIHLPRTWAKTVVYRPEVKPANQTARHSAAKPWLGLWISPVVLPAGSGLGFSTADLVQRVAEGSPAAQSGIIPGDLLLSVDGCGMQSSLCLAHALVAKRPGQTVEILRWSKATGKTDTLTVRLAGLVE